MKDDDYTMEEYKKNDDFIRSIANVDYGYGKPINCIDFLFPMPYKENETCGLEFNKDILSKCLLLDGKDCPNKRGKEFDK